jgi:arginyl-tRNA synthetase
MSYPLNEFKKEIISKIESEILPNEIKVKIDISPEGMGDFAFPCFSLSSIYKESPTKIAKNLSKKIEKGKWIEKIEANGGYLNFFVNKNLLIETTIDSIIKLKDKYGYLEKKDQKVIIEHTSANPNGPLHVGRARNPIIGDTLVRIFKASGYDVESQFYLDDLGKQVAILTWGLNNLKKSNLPGSEYEKSDHKNVIFYQEANKKMEKNDKVKEEIDDIVKKSEHGDKNTIELIHEAYSPVLKGINESLNRINIHIDKYIPESTFVKDKSVENVVKKLKNSNYCHEEDGAYYLDLKSFGIKGRNTKFFFLRRDGTTLYATRDIAYHIWKSRNSDLLVNILGEDHKLESKQVEISLKLLNEKKVPKAVFYSFVSLPSGKMSTRRARVVYLDELIDECIERAYIEVKKRRHDELTEDDMRKIAEIVGIGSLRYNIIKVQPEKDIIFKWEEALNFEGNAVPFIQYAHARACSILSKTNIKNLEYDLKLLKHESELKLIKQLAMLPLYIEEASTKFKPHIITNYLFETASKFNQFYRDCPVLSEKNDKLRSSRIILVNATKIVIRNSLEILGISAPEEM